MSKLKKQARKKKRPKFGMLSVDLAGIDKNPGITVCR
jgi:hypothetical protein